MRWWFRWRSSCPANTRTRVRFLRTYLSARWPWRPPVIPEPGKLGGNPQAIWGVRLLDSTNFGFGNRPCFSTWNGKWLGKPGITFWILHATCRCGSTNMHTHTRENRNGMFDGLRSRLFLACSRFHMTAWKWGIFFILFWLKTTVLWDEVSLIVLDY